MHFLGFLAEILLPGYNIMHTRILVQGHFIGVYAEICIIFWKYTVDIIHLPRLQISHILRALGRALSFLNSTHIHETGSSLFDVTELEKAVKRRRISSNGPCSDHGNDQDDGDGQDHGDD